jgi:beta-glucanase (GH16 family)
MALRSYKMGLWFRCWWLGAEAQSYTNADNVIVAGGNLKSAKKVGSSYTSALKSENKFEFTYGKVEVRAKLTTGQNLAHMDAGRNYATNTWPSCGEIDIMDLKEVTFYYLRYVTLSR